MEALIGKTFRAVETYDNAVYFRGGDGAESYKLYHEEDWSETVTIEDICGDLSDLVGVPIADASEDINCESLDDDTEQQWTFYNIRTIKGTVTIRFHGTSNGYYSMAVSLAKIS